MTGYRTVDSDGVKNVHRRVAVGLAAAAVVVWALVAAASVVLGGLAARERCRPSGEGLESEWDFLDAGPEWRLPVPGWTCTARHVPTGQMVEWEAARTPPWRSGG